MRHLVESAQPQNCAGLDVAKAARAAVVRTVAQHESLAESYARRANDHEDLAALDPAAAATKMVRFDASGIHSIVMHRGRTFAAPIVSPRLPEYMSIFVSRPGQ